jgi:hypothetical protein
MAFRISRFRDTEFNDINGTGIFIMEAIVYCDTVADLPRRFDITNHNLVIGCKAIIVSTGDKYYLASDGNWKKDESGGGGGGGGGGGDEVVAHTVAEWNEIASTTKSEYGVIYIYTDYYTQGGVKYPAMKVGDGNAYVVDLPFFSSATSNPSVVAHTTEEWNQIASTTKSEYGVIYIYTDYTQHEGVDIPAMKIGDGNAFVVDLPFFSSVGTTQPYITYEDVDRWNEKVAATVDPVDGENLVLFNN